MKNKEVLSTHDKRGNLTGRILEVRYFEAEFVRIDSNGLERRIVRKFEDYISAQAYVEDKIHQETKGE